MDVQADVIVDEQSRSARFSGEIDLASYDRFTAAMSQLGSTGDIVCDLTDVTFMDSSGIRLFVQMQRSRDAGSAVVLRNPAPNVERVFALTGLSDLGIRVEHL
ncbi:MAG TPA: STAS domain-containing protein [Actinomycetota bacterium]|nr:STAS domain-containing protein [Actinomycetota bacterium]